MFVKHLTGSSLLSDMMNSQDGSKAGDFNFDEFESQLSIGMCLFLYSFMFDRYVHKYVYFGTILYLQYNHFSHIIL